VKVKGSKKCETPVITVTARSYTYGRRNRKRLVIRSSGNYRYYSSGHEMDVTTVSLHRVIIVPDDHKLSLRCPVDRALLNGSCHGRTVTLIQMIIVELEFSLLSVSKGGFSHGRGINLVSNSRFCHVAGGITHSFSSPICNVKE
jgi:hypothetical protein